MPAEKEKQSIEPQDVAQVKASELAAPTAPEGVRARRALAMKNLLPDADWINKNVVAGGAKTQALVGRIFGVATGYEEKASKLPDGSQSMILAIKGSFQYESYVTGEFGEGTMVYFPRAYAEKIKAVFDIEKTIEVVEVDADIGLEATGKTIPYEWVVIAYREGEAMAVLKRLRSARSRPANLLGRGIMGGAQGTAPAIEVTPEPKALPAE